MGGGSGCGGRRGSIDRHAPQQEAKAGYGGLSWDLLINETPADRHCLLSGRSFFPVSPSWKLAPKVCLLLGSRFDPVDKMNCSSPVAMLSLSEVRQYAVL